MLKDSRPIRNSQRRERVREEVVQELLEGAGMESTDQSAQSAAGPQQETDEKKV